MLGRDRPFGPRSGSTPAPSATFPPQRDALFVPDSDGRDGRFERLLGEDFPMERGTPPARVPPMWVQRRVQKTGLRPRYAAMMIAAVWLGAVVIFGIVEHLVDPESFPTVWLAMWWALETVTTVGYGDVVPGSTAGKVIASFLLLGGLSLLAVVTGVVTSVFVAEAQAQRQATGGDPHSRSWKSYRASWSRCRRSSRGAGTRAISALDPKACLASRRRRNGQPDE